jgi:hypothetical protein
MKDSDLDQLLKDCVTPVTPSASFTRDVWLRVEATELDTWQVRADRVMERFLGLFALPPVAVATCAAMVVVGAWFGLNPAQSARSAELAYIQSVSPFSQSPHR